MKVVFLCLFIASAYAASAVLEEVQEKQYPRFIDFPDGEGNMHKVDLEAEPDLESIDEITRNPDNNVYLLFTRQNQASAQTLVMNNANSIRNSNFNPNRPTKVIVHGWLSNRDTEPNPTVRRAYLNRSDVNIITVCWRRLAALDYASAVRGVPNIGRGVGQFIDFLVRTSGARLNQFHLIGFSLGAHVVGNAGRQLGGRVARVMGLDPAGPLWVTNNNRLRASDGVYVEAIHTDGGSSASALGIGRAVADADFFPNGGVSQPGCSTNLCNHNRAWELFAATVTRNHLTGRRCTTTAQITLNTCTGAQLRMGNDDLNKRGTGMYRVNTGRTYPF